MSGWGSTTRMKTTRTFRQCREQLRRHSDGRAIISTPIAIVGLALLLSAYAEPAIPNPEPVAAPPGMAAFAHLLPFTHLATKPETGHLSRMFNPKQNGDYLAGRLFVGLFALLSVALAAWMVWEIHVGVVRDRFGITNLTDNPVGFWIEIVFQGALVLFFSWQANRLRRFAKR
jgi:hypothetical protein